jgi:hypothetical protein
MDDGRETSNPSARARALRALGAFPPEPSTVLTTVRAVQPLAVPPSVPRRASLPAPTSSRRGPFAAAEGTLREGLRVAVRSSDWYALDQHRNRRYLPVGATGTVRLRPASSPGGTYRAASIIFDRYPHPRASTGGYWGIGSEGDRVTDALLEVLVDQGPGPAPWKRPGPWGAPSESSAPPVPSPGPPPSSVGTRLARASKATEAASAALLEAPPRALLFENIGTGGIAVEPDPDAPGRWRVVEHDLAFTRRVPVGGYAWPDALAAVRARGADLTRTEPYLPPSSAERRPEPLPPPPSSRTSIAQFEAAMDAAADALKRGAPHALLVSRLNKTGHTLAIEPDPDAPGSWRLRYYDEHAAPRGTSSGFTRWTDAVDGARRADGDLREAEPLRPEPVLKRREALPPLGPVGQAIDAALREGLKRFRTTHRYRDLSVASARIFVDPPTVLADEARWAGEAAVDGIARAMKYGALTLDVQRRILTLTVLEWSRLVADVAEATRLVDDVPDFLRRRYGDANAALPFASPHASLAKAFPEPARWRFRELLVSAGAFRDAIRTLSPGKRRALEDAVREDLQGGELVTQRFAERAGGRPHVIRVRFSELGLPMRERDVTDRFLVLDRTRPARRDVGQVIELERHGQVRVVALALDDEIACRNLDDSDRLRPDLMPARLAPPTWTTGDKLRGANPVRYLMVVGAYGDPLAQDVDALPAALRARQSYWRSHAVSVDVDEWTWALWLLLGDGRPRTWGAIRTELFGDEIGGAPDRALLDLVEEGLIEHTTEVPILFRRRADVPSPAIPAHIERDVLRDFSRAGGAR